MLARQKPLIDLAESNPTQVGLALPDSERILRLSEDANALYRPDAKGLPQAREAVSRYYAELGVRVSPERIVLTSGTSEGYSFLLKLLLEPGESIAVPSPSYPLLGWLGRWEGVQTRPYPLTFTGNRWAIHWASAAKVFAGSRAALVIHPNNPTGHYTSAEDRKKLLEASKTGGSTLISDEVFYDYSNEASKPPSFAAESGALTFVLSGLSKVLALPQMKVSWIVVNGPEAVAAEALERLELLADSYLSVNTPAQNALPYWMAERQNIQEILRGRITRNRTLLRQFQEQSKSVFRFLESEGGWQGILRWDSGPTDEELALGLLEKQAVYVHPGYFYDFDDDHFLVVSLIVEPAKLEEGLARILKHTPLPSDQRSAHPMSS